MGLEQQRDTAGSKRSPSECSEAREEAAVDWRTGLARTRSTVMERKGHGKNTDTRVCM